MCELRVRRGDIQCGPRRSSSSTMPLLLLPLLLRSSLLVRFLSSPFTQLCQSVEVPAGSRDEHGCVRHLSSLVPQRPTLAATPSTNRLNDSMLAAA